MALGVRYPDGRKATTLDRHRRECNERPPDGPLLSWWPGSSGVRGSAGWRCGSSGKSAGVGPRLNLWWQGLADLAV